MMQRQNNRRAVLQENPMQSNARELISQINAIYRVSISFGTGIRILKGGDDGV
jgi:hypothetical protein